MANIFNRARTRWWSFIKKKWWLPIPFIGWELLKDRFYAWANNQIDQEAGAMLSPLRDAVGYLASTPLAATILLAVVVLLLLFIHSYWIEYWGRPETIEAEEAPEPDTYLVEAIYYIASGGDWSMPERENTPGKWPGEGVDYPSVLAEISSAMRQHAYNGKLPIWGKRKTSDLLIPIESEYFEKYGFGGFGDMAIFGDAEKILFKTKADQQYLDDGIFWELKTNRAKVEELWPLANI